MAAADGERWRDLDMLLTRQGNVVGPNFQPGSHIREFLADCRVLLVGAGGLGCEVLKDLALSGFGNIDVIDMDTIDVSNLNRQFLFRMQDVGKPKAEIAAARIKEHVSGITVTPHFCRIEEKPISFYEDFLLVVLGLDSIEARRYMNSVMCSFLQYDDEGNPDPATIKPMIDGGSEGFKGHARVILPGLSPCFECTLWLFPPQTKFPLCTLAETPRNPVHCIEYAKLVLWSQQRRGEEFDPDVEEHMQWVFKKATERANLFGIQGFTFQFTQGVVKNIIPAVASTNAIVAAVCSLEALKMVTACSTGMSNYMMYMGGEGIYTHTVAYERDPECLVCSPGISFPCRRDMTLQQVIDIIKEDERLGTGLEAPSLSCGSTNLYMRGVLEEATRPNLEKRMGELVPEGSVLQVNDKNLSRTIRLRLAYKDGVDEDMQI
ncbi:unnamed protein product [Ostreobium quekettii]|uniref:NEDD8-activating enzyme E1 catalytic subunit n=1 Tax=Ostreobium quekettii TaxID=121088 RepID=A0A8S1IY13_9CHLO|nr:unnamed protein product [Ostreobium quekettii]|eukprot:evm.model.scf_612.4 EVM.evm.TU.scf_612.4   scf_612:30860-38680(+)